MEIIFALLFWIVIGYIIFRIFKVIIRAFRNDFVDQQEEEKQHLPYIKKRFFFTRSEEEFFRVLKEELDPQRYAIFPKVRLGDFVEVRLPADERRPWWNRIKSRHIDFLIWDIEQKQIALAIELDGASHNGYTAQKVDDFKNRLYETIEMRLVRIKVGTNFVEGVKKLQQFL